MSFIEDVSNSASRIAAAVAFSLVATTGMSGCAGLNQKMSKVNVGGLPVGSVVAKTVIQGSKGPREEAVRTITEPILLRDCSNKQEQKQQESGATGALNKVWDSLFALHVKPTFGPCPNPSTLTDQNGVPRRQATPR